MNVRRIFSTFSENIIPTSIVDSYAVIVCLNRLPLVIFSRSIIINYRFIISPVFLINCPVYNTGLQGLKILIFQLHFYVFDEKKNNNCLFYYFRQI